MKEINAHCKSITTGEPMIDNHNKFEDYFSHLQKISFIGRIYKRFFSSPILFFCARRFGRRVVEIGSGTGNGILGTFSKRVHGLEINPVSVNYCKAMGLNVDLIHTDGVFPMADGVFDSCVLDNVLEHIEEPSRTLDECYRITKKNGGLIIVVPGLRGFQSDSDHKVFYNFDKLRKLDGRWQLVNSFSIPFIFKSERLSKSLKQYCIVATYRKI
jgi:SAM-dependent methyltransferase